MSDGDGLEGRESHCHRLDYTQILVIQPERPTGGREGKLVVCG